MLFTQRAVAAATCEAAAAAVETCYRASWLLVLVLSCERCALLLMQPCTHATACNNADTGPRSSLARSVGSGRTARRLRSTAQRAPQPRQLMREDLLFPSAVSPPASSRPPNACVDGQGDRPLVI